MKKIYLTTLFMGFTIYSNVNQASDDLTQKISQSIYQHEIIEESSKKILEILSFMEMSDKIPTTVESQAWAEKRKEILQHSLLETFSPEELNKINSLVQSSFFKELVTFKILEIGIAMFTGSIILADKENSIETSRFVDRTDSLSPSELNKTHDKIGRVVLVGTTLFKDFKASFKTILFKYISYLFYLY